MKSQYPVAELGRLVRQISQRNRSGADHEVFSVTNSEGFTRSTEYFSKEVFSKDVSNYKVVAPGQFAYNPSRINVGSIDYLREPTPVLVSPLYVVFEGDQHLHADYLLRYLKSDWGNAQIRANTEGAVRDSLKFKGLESIKVPLPELNDQIRIAHLLGKVEGLIARRKQQLQQLDDLLKGVFLEMFGDPVRNDKKWPQRDLESFIDNARGISYGIVQRGDHFPGGVPVLRIRDVVSERYVESDLVRTAPANSLKYSRTILQGGELLLSIRGTVGVVSIAPSHGKGWNVSRELAVIPVTEGINVTYLVHLLRSAPVQRVFASMIKGVAQSGLNLGDIRRIRAILPPGDMQKEFERFAATIGSVTTLYRHSLTDLEALYGALSQQAFKGELDLSRVSLSDAELQEPQTAIPATSPSPDEAPNVIDLPDTELLQATLDDRARLKELLPFWLESYRAQLNGAAFSAQDFLSAAQTRIAELHPVSDFELDAEAYEQVKTWVFKALDSGRLKQGYADADNRVTLASGLSDRGTW
jgi:type I restriction enzyme S subunit